MCDAATSAAGMVRRHNSQPRQGDTMQRRDNDFDDTTVSDLCTMTPSLLATYVETAPVQPRIDEDESDCGVWLARLLSR